LLWGGHYEANIQLVRLILTGVFDKYPDLQIILGHCGEVVLFYLERLGSLSKLLSHSASSHMSRVVQPKRRRCFWGCALARPEYPAGTGRVVRGEQNALGSNQTRSAIEALGTLQGRPNSSPAAIASFSLRAVVHTLGSLTAMSRQLPASPTAQPAARELTPGSRSV
jgi:hypothetical protein